MLTLLFLLPLAFLIALNLPFRRAVMNELAFVLGALFSLYQAILSLCPCESIWSNADHALYAFLAWTPSTDALTRVMLLSIGLVSMCAFFVLRGVVDNSDKRFLFANLFLLAIAGMNGLVLSTDLFTVWLFIEVTAVPSIILIAFNREGAGLEGAYKYFLLSAVASAFLLAAIALLLLSAGGTSFAEVRRAMGGQSASHIVSLAAMGLFAAGLLIKGGVMPFHGWLPDAYSSAPSPAAVLIAGIITKTCGIYTLIRLISGVISTPSVLGWTHSIQIVLLTAGMLSIIAGALLALGQSDFKRMLAYSSISQVGYIVLGAASGMWLGIAGAVFHILNHAVFKSLLFINAAAVEKQCGTLEMQKLGGLALRMPVTGTSSVIALLSAAGVPPLSGFWSKLIIVVALWQAGYALLAVLAILAGVLTLAYFLLLQRRVFFGQLAPGFESLREAPFFVALPQIILSLVTLGLGIGFPWLFGTFLMPLGSFL